MEMTQKEAYDILLACFKAQSDERRKNLRWHARQGTAICCGKRAHLWSCEGGG